MPHITRYLHTCCFYYANVNKLTAVWNAWVDDSCALQVAWLEPVEKVTWELASTIPKGLIDEFEAGVSLNEKTLVSKPTYGVVSHTLIMSDHLQTETPASKRPRQNLSLEEGYASIYSKHTHVIVCEPLYNTAFSVIMELPDWHVTRKKIEASNFIIELQVCTCTYYKQVLTQSMLLCGMLMHFRYTSWNVAMWCTSNAH